MVFMAAHSSQRNDTKLHQMRSSAYFGHCVIETNYLGGRNLSVSFDVFALFPAQQHSSVCNRSLSGNVFPFCSILPPVVRCCHAFSADETNT